MALGTPKIIIVGAGIIGASIAYHLGGRLAAVTVIDGGDEVPGATARSFAWINSWSGALEPYARLRYHSVLQYHRWQGSFGGELPLKLSGALIWKSRQEDTEKRVRDQATAGIDVRVLGQDDIYHAEPRLLNTPDCVAFAASEGALEPAETTRLLLQTAQNNHVKVMRPAKVETLLSEAGRITGVRVDGTDFGADIVILAAGTATVELAASVGITVPLEPSPGLLAHFRAPGRLLGRVVISPDLEVRQISDDVIVAAAAYIDDSEENGPDAVADRILAQIRTRFDGGENVELDRVQVGWRPMPVDGLPIVGFAPGVEGLYLAAMHSGITLAPAIGQFAAAEVLDDIEVDMLDFCRPGRFQT